VSNVFPAAHGAKAGTALVLFVCNCQNWAVFNKSNVSIVMQILQRWEL
jgi:hypothetical protein